MEATDRKVFKFAEFCEVSYELYNYTFKSKTCSAWSCEAVSYYSGLYGGLKSKDLLVNIIGSVGEKCCSIG
jgi:hypothetical protein